MMDTKVAGLLGVVGVFVASTPGYAAPQPPPAQTVLQARSYAELLRPVPNALATLQALDSEGGRPQLELAQLGPVVRDLLGDRRHYHHHHHHHYRRRYIHRHHHYDHHHYRHYDDSVIRR